VCRNTKYILQKPTPKIKQPAIQLAINQLFQYLKSRSTNKHGLKKPLSPTRSLKSADVQPKAALKLKSVLLIPECHYEAEQCMGLDGGAWQQRRDPSLDWQIMKSKHDLRSTAHSSLVRSSKQQYQRKHAPPL
jgi:hypothetical protein